MTTSTAVRGRIGWVDRVRGAAVLLMVLDHLLVVVGGGEVLRVSLTRLALPAFCLAAGMVLDHRRRLTGRLVVALGVELVVGGMVVGLSVPGPVLLVVWATVVLQLLPVRARWLVVSLAVIQPFTWPMGSFWTGYEPGTVLALVAVGRWLGPSVSAEAGVLPGWLEAVGRRPVAWYVGHLLVLALIVLVAQ